MRPSQPAPRGRQAADGRAVEGVGVHCCEREEHLQAGTRSPHARGRQRGVAAQAVYHCTLNLPRPLSAGDFLAQPK